MPRSASRACGDVFENNARQAIAGLVTAQSMLGVKRPERGIHAASTHEVQKTLDKTDALGRRMLKRPERRAPAAGIRGCWNQFFGLLRKLLESGSFGQSYQLKKISPQSSKLTAVEI